MSYALISEQYFSIENQTPFTQEFIHSLKKYLMDMYELNGFEGGYYLEIKGVLDGTPISFLDGIESISPKRISEFQGQFHHMDLMEKLDSFHKIELNIEFDLDLYYLQAGMGVARIKNLLNEKLADHVWFLAKEQVDFKETIYAFVKEGDELVNGYMQPHPDLSNLEKDSSWKVRQFYFNVGDDFEQFSADELNQLSAICQQIKDRYSLDARLTEDELVVEFDLGQVVSFGWIHEVFLNLKKVYDAVKKTEDFFSSTIEVLFVDTENEFKELLLCVTELPEQELYLGLIKVSRKNLGEIHLLKDVVEQSLPLIFDQQT